MNQRYRMYLGAIAVLAVVNVGRWGFSSATGERAVRDRSLLAQDFRLRVDVQSGARTGRDLFLPAGGRDDGQHAAGGLGGRGGRSTRSAVKRLGLRPASSADASQVVAQNNLARLRLLGVVFHAGKRQAYLAQDKKNCIAAAGDTVFGQYAVDEIAVDAVTLRDTNTNMTRRIPVSGK